MAKIKVLKGTQKQIDFAKACLPRMRAIMEQVMPQFESEEAEEKEHFAETGKHYFQLEAMFEVKALYEQIIAKFEADSKEVILASFIIDIKSIPDNVMGFMQSPTDNNYNYIMTRMSNVLDLPVPAYKSIGKKRDSFGNKI